MDELNDHFNHADENVFLNLINHLLMRLVIEILFFCKHFYQERLGEMRSSRLHELPGCTENTEDQKDLPQQRQVHTSTADLPRSGFLITACLITVWVFLPSINYIPDSKKVLTLGKT